MKTCWDAQSETLSETLSETKTASRKKSQRCSESRYGHRNVLNTWIREYVNMNSWIREYDNTWIRQYVLNTTQNSLSATGLVWVSCTDSHSSSLVLLDDWMEKTWMKVTQAWHCLFWCSGGSTRALSTPTTVKDWLKEGLQGYIWPSRAIETVKHHI